MPLLLYLLIISLHAASPVFLSPSLSALNGSTCHAQSQKCTTSYVLDRFDTNRFGNVCALDWRSRLRCFGRDLNGLSGEEDIKWAKIALGYRHMCGILAEDSDSDRGVVRCQGNNIHLQAQVPSDYKDVKFKNICSGAYFSCGIVSSLPQDSPLSQLVCWGDSPISHEAEQVFRMKFSKLSCSHFSLCAIEEGIDRLHCWGDEDIMRKSVHLRERRLRNVSVGYDHACAIEVDSSMNVCWGSNSKILEDEDGHVQTFVTEKSRSFHRKIEQVSAGWDHSCAVDAYRRLTCWGDVGVGGKGMQRGGGGGGEPGGEFLAVKASTHYSCAVHVSGTLMCWGESLPGMEQTNWERLQMCDEGNTLQVAHFGPMLSSITHIDGSWLLFVDKDVNLFEDEFVMIENPLANSFHLQTQGKLQVDVVVARIPKGVESLDVMLFVDEKQVTSKTIRRQELGAETPTLCDYNNHDCIERREEHLSFEVNNLSEGFHLVEAAALIDGSAAISHKIPFTLLLPARSTQDNPPSYLIPQVAVVKKEIVPRGEVSEMIIWLALFAFDVGTNGSVILNNINAKELVFFSSYSKHHLTDVSWPSKLWPIATISTLEQRNTFRLNRVLDAEECLLHCEEGMILHRLDNHAEDGTSTLHHPQEGKLVQLAVLISSTIQDCEYNTYTISLENERGLPFEENSALSQLEFSSSCRLLEQEISRELLARSINRRILEAPLLRHLPPLSGENENSRLSCYYLAAPLDDALRTLNLSFPPLPLPETTSPCKTEVDNRIVGFYHVSTVGERWITTVKRQLKMLRESVTYELVDKIVVGVSGFFSNAVRGMTTKMGWEKFEFVDHNDKDMYRKLGGSHVAREVPTLQLMYEHCKRAEQQEDYVFYLHSKGVGHPWPKFKWTQDWTMYMESALFEHPHLCLHALSTGSDACGTELYQRPHLHYAGNFWWTTCERVKQLQEPDSMLPMTLSTWGKPENWIGSIPNSSMMSLLTAYSSNPYGTDLPRYKYEQALHHIPRVFGCPSCVQTRDATRELRPT